MGLQDLPKNERKVQTAFRFTKKEEDFIKSTSKKYGVTQTAIMRYGLELVAQEENKK